MISGYNRAKVTGGHHMQLQFKDFCKDESNIYMADLVLAQGEHTVGHKHNFYEFFVVLEGTFIHYCNQKETKLTKGMCKIHSTRSLS